jgi:hypothetical protein
MPVFRVADATANAMLDEFNARLGYNATLKFYTGRMPALPSDPVDMQKLLATLSFANPAAPFATNRTLIFSTLDEDPRAAASGDATWVRASDGRGNAVFDADVGDENRPRCVVMMNSTLFAAGGPIRIESFTIWLPT